MRPEQVFHDPGGRRRRAVGRGGVALLLVAGALGTLFVLSLLVVPLLPRAGGSSRLAGAVAAFPRAVPRERRLDRHLFEKTRAELYREARRSEARERSARAPGGAVSAAFYAPWQETGLHSLRAHADRLTHLMPEWLHLTPDGGGLDLSDFDLARTPHNRDVLTIARHASLAVLPILSNGNEGVFDPVRAGALLSSPAKRRAVAAAVRDFLLAHRLAGVNVDLENLRPHDAARLPELLADLRATLSPAGLAITVDVEASTGADLLRRIAAPADLVVLMAYDEHDSTGTPGPIASIGWFDRVVARALQSVPREKLLVGVGGYGYDWREGAGPAEPISYQEAMILARDFRSGESPAKVVDFDPAALNPTFEYADDAGRAHEVWLLDAVTAWNQWHVARARGVAGVALWVLGQEDPGVWNTFRPAALAAPPAPDALSRIRFPYDVEFEGEGELLSVLSTPQEGSRRLDVDPGTGLVVDEVYERYPASYVLRRTGYRPGLVALTFDDGPDPDFTPKVLDVLRRHGVPATFFVIGEQVERFPGLVQRAFREGHEIGSHSFTHPNLGAVTRRRTLLELNATQRALQATLGRGTRLFRPPYNADAEPASAEEIRPIVEAGALGYLTVGELIDPQDWNLYRTGPDGAEARRSPAEIAEAVVEGLRTTRGNVVLLHDGGGDRATTVAALDLLVPRLASEGRRFVRASELAGLSREAAMPLPAAGDRLLVGFDRVTFDAVFLLERLLKLAFLASVVLGIARVLFVVPLALVSARRRPLRPPASPPPTVSALVAAYDEAAVIVDTVRSLLASSAPLLEVIVVDDGSRDGTGDVVEAELGGDPRVRVIRQPNGGKASALNRALAASRGEILVCLDADTQVAPDAVGLLTRPFEDPAVVAVAGNVKVGNPVNLLARWQALEYVASQNLDRRAYALLNAITVVPGAIGAWRRGAVADAGGWVADTLAEDMDLTWRLRRRGGVLVAETAAVGRTEAPDSIRSFFRQRFRWAFGTLQCLVKHRSALGRHGWFGRLALPSLWLFQVVFQTVAPFADLAVLYSLVSFLSAWISRGLLTRDWQPLPDATGAALSAGFLYALLFVFELAAAAIAVRLDRERPSLLWSLLVQRIVYRQLMWAVVWKSVWIALRGRRQGWGKLERKGTVRPAGASRLG